MPLTLTWWEGAKKKHGKGAPTLGITPALKDYEKALKKLQDEKNLDNLNKARAALTAFEEVRKKALTKLDKDYEKWKDLYGDVSTLDGAVKKAKTEFDEIGEELGLAAKVEKAGSEAEAAYEIAWASFEKVRDGLKTFQDRGNYELALELLGDLKVKANKVIDSNDHFLKPKYQKQLKVVTGVETTVRNAFTAYDNAITTMVDDRKALLKEFETTDALLTQAKNQCIDLKERAAQAKQQGNAQDLLSLKKQAAMIASGALKRYSELADGAYKPGTKIRGALDVKAAKMSQKDSDDIIRPLSDKSFTAFKELTTAKKEIEELAKQVLTIT